MSEQFHHTEAEEVSRLQAGWIWAGAQRRSPEAQETLVALPQPELIYPPPPAHPWAKCEAQHRWTEFAEWVSEKEHPKLLPDVKGRHPYREAMDWVRATLCDLHESTEPEPLGREHLVAFWLTSRELELHYFNRLKPEMLHLLRLARDGALSTLDSDNRLLAYDLSYFKWPRMRGRAFMSRQRGVWKEFLQIEPSNKDLSQDPYRDVCSSVQHYITEVRRAEADLWFNLSYDEARDFLVEASDDELLARVRTAMKRPKVEHSRAEEPERESSPTSAKCKLGASQQAPYERPGVVHSSLEAIAPAAEDSTTSEPDGIREVARQPEASRNQEDPSPMVSGGTEPAESWLERLLAARALDAGSARLFQGHILVVALAVAALFWGLREPLMSWPSLYSFILGMAGLYVLPMATYLVTSRERLERRWGGIQVRSGGLRTWRLHGFICGVCETSSRVDRHVFRRCPDCGTPWCTEDQTGGAHWLVNEHGHAVDFLASNKATACEECVIPLAISPHEPRIPGAQVHSARGLLQSLLDDREQGRRYLLSIGGVLSSSLLLLASRGMHSEALGGIALLLLLTSGLYCLYVFASGQLGFLWAFSYTRSASLFESNPNSTSIPNPFHSPAELPDSSEAHPPHDRSVVRFVRAYSEDDPVGEVPKWAAVRDRLLVVVSAVAFPILAALALWALQYQSRILIDDVEFVSDPEGRFEQVKVLPLAIAPAEVLVDSFPSTDWDTGSLEYWRGWGMSKRTYLLQSVDVLTSTGWAVTFCEYGRRPLRCVELFWYPERGGWTPTQWSDESTWAHLKRGN